MKITNIILSVIVVLMTISTINNSFAQMDNFVREECSMTNIPQEYSPPFKPTATGSGVFNAIVVYVMFKDEAELNGNENNLWPLNTTTGPSYKGTMLATSKNSITDWWNAYNPNTQTISSWFCEVSRGTMHVVGDEFFVKLDEDTAYYQSPGRGESEVNREIYSKLNSQGINWSKYDQWEYHSDGTITNNQDGVIDMIYKVHRYKYSGIFSEGDASGFCYLGMAKNEMHYLVDSYNQKYVYGGFPNYTTGEMKGSGLTLAGNKTSGILTKGGVYGRIWHEHGHYTYGTVHGRIGVMGEDVWDPFMCLTEKIHIGYETPYYSNVAYEEKILGDISGRSTSNPSSIRVQLTSGEILIGNRNKISNWDRPMLGDTAYGDFMRETNYGQGIYFYHISGLGYPGSILEDIECSDGLWNWVQDGYAAPDWDVNNPWLPVLKRTNPVRDKNDNGWGVNVNQDPNTAKDGLTIRGTTTSTTSPVGQKWFSIGKKKTSNSDGIDRIFANDEENWTSRENQIDRWDAWTKGEIFSRYSSPSTMTYNDENSGVFIWIKDFDNSTKQATIRIYRDAALYPNNGWTESDILEATPPSKPMGIKTSYEFEPNTTICHPKITWSQNTEPDMVNDNGEKRYIVYRAVTDNITQLPTNYYVRAIVDIDANLAEAYYVDNQIIGIESTLSGDGEYEPYRLRYKVIAVDKYSDESVFSDFTDATGLKPEGSSIDPGNNDNPILKPELPKAFNLSQNYPNPFNPITKINFALPKQGFVTLKIYDITGREFKTLVNEFKQAGNYTVDFNGSLLSSGVYFYKIQSGDFVSVKRMVLIK